MDAGNYRSRFGTVCLNAMIFFALVLVLSGCGTEDDDETDGGDLFSDAALFPAVADAEYADVLVDCVSAETVDESCLLSTLPLIGQQGTAPTIETIMSRTVISDDWMAQRFRQYLQVAPAEIINLFGAVTAVVIARDIRPSFYTTGTAAIYLDPADLWLTNAEKATIDRAADYRSDFGNELAFVPLFRYVVGQDYAWDNFSLTDDSERTIADIILPLSALLLHELAHANDVFPPSLITSLDSSETAVEAAFFRADSGVSAILSGFSPLNSETLMGLGEVLYAGRTATDLEKSLSATDVGNEFEPDGASDSYSYSSTFEDVAMLFEEVMLKHLFNVDREFAYTDAPPEGLEQFCDGYVIQWGFRNRVSETLVESRAELVLQELLGQADVSDYLASLDDPQRMTNGIDWCTIQALGPPGALTVSPSSVTGDGERQLLRPEDRLPPRHFYQPRSTWTTVD
jgi:hypothetical protein